MSSRDYMSELNHYVQSEGLTANWSFTSTGPDHAATHTAYLKIGTSSQPVALGTGASQNKAKAQAAQAYIELLEHGR